MSNKKLVLAAVFGILLSYLMIGWLFIHRFSSPPQQQPPQEPLHPLGWVPVPTTNEDGGPVQALVFNGCVPSGGGALVLIAGDAGVTLSDRACTFTGLMTQNAALCTVVDGGYVFVPAGGTKTIPCPTHPMISCVDDAGTSLDAGECLQVIVQ